MDYSNLSDFEINAAVFVALHGGAPDYKEGDGGAMVLLSFEGDVIGGDAVEVEVERGRFNPCSNPDEAWPIIEEHEINILWNWNDEGVHGATASPLYEYEHPNALRAAMTVFLMKHG